MAWRRRSTRGGADRSTLPRVDPPLIASLDGPVVSQRAAQDHSRRPLALTRDVLINPQRQHPLDPQLPGRVETPKRLIVERSP